MQSRTPALIGFSLLLVACNDPRSTQIPADFSKLSEIQPALDKLDSTDRTRVAAYEMRVRLGGMFGGSAPRASVTIGEAIDAQKAFEAEEARHEREEKALAAKIAAERTAKLAAIDNVLVAALTGRQIKQNMFMSMTAYALTFQNKSSKSIVGIKGTAVFRDVFGDEIAHQPVKVEREIKPGTTATDPEAVLLSSMDDGFAQLKDTPMEKVRFRFEPSTILFGDGSKLEVPEVENP